MTRSRIAIIGAGWAGLAAAVWLTESGHEVSLYEMAGQAGGRAKGWDSPQGWQLDNGQHILIGAYHTTLGLLRKLGLNEASAFQRLPLTLVDSSGQGLKLQSGPSWWTLPKAVLQHTSWSLQDRLTLLRWCLYWMLRGFKSPAGWTVTQLSASLPSPLQDELIEPLCVAALNTPADQACAQVFLTVLKESLWGGSGASDLLIPRPSLSELLPATASLWLKQHGCKIKLRAWVKKIEPEQRGWQVIHKQGVETATSSYEKVVIATTSSEAARLVMPHHSGWAKQAQELDFEPIATLYLQASGFSLPQPMILLPGHRHPGPAQFVFDHSQISGQPGLTAWVVSGAQKWVDQGADQLQQAILQQAQTVWGAQVAPSLKVIKLIIEKRATFRCTPGLRRPDTKIGEHLYAVGDYIDGLYPATLEGAVRSSWNMAQTMNTP
jgi:hydroxysqualene dehydroxylase